MPELPEVETVRRGLIPAVEGRRITAAELRRPDLRWPLPHRMAERLQGQRVEQLRRRSKYLLLDLSSGETLIVHLGMSGRLLVSVPEETAIDGGRSGPGQFHHEVPARDKHDHVSLELENGARVVFNDARRFGMMDLVETSQVEEHWLLSALGPEPLGNEFSDAYLLARLQGRSMPIKAALLDQKVVAGLGNIYVCEALFRAGIAPWRKAGRIAAARVARLVPAIREVLSDAIEAGGSSLRDYRQAGGELGYFQHSFRVYGREGEACVTPGCDGLVRRAVQSGRSTFHCPACQR